MTRNVSVGQTVAASFNTPTLFIIAKDITKMQVQAAVSEADIGDVKIGLRVTFTVDAYPDITFSGTVNQIRLEPVVSANVVTYTTIITRSQPGPQAEARDDGQYLHFYQRDRQRPADLRQGAEIQTGRHDGKTVHRSSRTAPANGRCSMPPAKRRPTTRWPPPRIGMIRPAGWSIRPQPPAHRPLSGCRSGDSLIEKTGHTGLNNDTQVQILSRADDRTTRWSTGRRSKPRPNLPARSEARLCPPGGRLLPTRPRSWRRRRRSAAAR